MIRKLQIPIKSIERVLDEIWNEQECDYTLNQSIGNKGEHIFWDLQLINEWIQAIKQTKGGLDYET